MRNLNLLITIITVLVFWGCSRPQQKSVNTLSKKEISDGWQLLFDGETLSEWKMFNGGAVSGWKIVDGVLHNSGQGSDHGGDIITKKQYADFELYLEWKIAPESNSGIFYRVQEGLTDAIYETGPEYQLLDDKGWSSPLEANQYSGANYGMNAPENARVKPTGEWNTTRIIVNKAHVEHWLNTTKVVEYELWTDDWAKNKAQGKWAETPHYGMAKTGHIGLQDHGGLTMFRNIKIKEL
ncbi:DUF1080 domain-containing protein [uncultured Draconibacterium sp.]|uniref:3-keto-disaccharide hydrolase n=1 Tax=uncultured Draconibacterium sp. TaxID=1573823 RepID=UPI003261800E